MNADDAADALMDLPQDRRRPVLQALPHVTTLLGYGEQTAGGLMSMDFVTMPPAATVGEELTAAVRHAAAKPPQALTGVFLLDERQRLTGAVTLVALVQATPETLLKNLAEPDPVRVLADTDTLAITRLMADYDLLLLPVVDTDNHILGLITVDDALRDRDPPRTGGNATPTHG